MAFYTSRVDNEGNELERRQSVRSIDPSICASNLNASLSGSSTFIPLASDRSLGAKSSVRYINSAACIEKSANEDSDQSSVSVDLTVTSSSHIVPRLDLNSEDNSSTVNEFTYPRISPATNSEAFDTWWSAKQKLLLYEAARRQQIEEERRREKEERKKLAEKKFKEWKRKKQEQQEKMYEKQNKTPDVCATRSQISAQEARARVEEWEEKKRLEEESRREMKRAEEERRKQWEEQRRRMAAEAWKAWISEAANKPKPVPLNRGIFTLRGTISDIYVNPNEWQQVSPET